RRQPEKIKPPHRIGKELAEEEGPGLTVGQQFKPANLLGLPRGILLLIRVAVYVVQFRLSNLLVFTRHFIRCKPEDKPYKSERTRDNESPFPSPYFSDKRHSKGRYYRAEVGAGIENTGCERALPLREPLGRGLDGSGEVTG